MGQKSFTNIYQHLATGDVEDLHTFWPIIWTEVDAFGIGVVSRTPHGTMGSALKRAATSVPHWKKWQELARKRGDQKRAGTMGQEPKNVVKIHNSPNNETVSK